MRSPGRPDPSRVVQRQFWRLIATGVTTVRRRWRSACRGRSGARWFRHAGGMPPISSGRAHGPVPERSRSARRSRFCSARSKGVREIARAIGRDPGTISRELRRNAATRGGKQEYRATVAQWKAQQAAKRPKSGEARWATTGCVSTYRNGSPADRPPARRHDRHRAADARVEGAEQAAPAGQAMGDGMEPGADLAPACMSTSPMMSPCASATRRSTSRCSSRAVVRSSVSWSRVCVPAGHYGAPGARSQNKPQGHVTADVVLSRTPRRGRGPRGPRALGR